MAVDEKTSDVDVSSGDVQYVVPHRKEHLARKLGGKEVQLFAVGGAIGTSVFLTMGTWLPNGGPAGLLLGIGLWCFNVWCVNESFAEMTVYAPVPSPFITFTASWVDEALAFAQSWAFFLAQVLLVPYEITAVHVLITFWTDKLPVEAVVIIVLAIYSVLNVFSVEWFGKAEFYLSIGKVFLIFLCFAFTFFTMVGCNPQHYAYGFTYWQTPGAFSEYLTTGALGRFWGVISCMTYASFAVCGPEYTSSVAAETRSPRRILPSCYRSFKWRLLFFFVGSALCMGIVIPYNDPSLAAFIDGTVSGSGTSAASPFTIAMNRMNITGLPHLLNAVMVTSVLSCGNGVLFASSRALFAMAQAGRAPKILSRTTKRGIPIYAVAVCLLTGLLGMMGTNTNALKVLDYFIDLCTVAGQFNYMCVCIAYLHFYYNMKKQGISRDSLPYKSPFQPYAAYIGATCAVLAMLFLGFDTLHPFDKEWFFLDYTLLAVLPVAAIVWKLVKKTKHVKIGTADLGLGGLVKEVDDYEEAMEVEEEGWFEKIFSGEWRWRDVKDSLASKKE
ncbi:putative general amino acid permease [Xylariales sp. PMI_506]|nr:putative general amino acid permease [Xylariales sp. PMI_506]